MTVEKRSRIDDLADEWDDLADRTGASPFLRPGWLAAWRRAFGAGRLELLAARRGGRLAALVALERRRSVLRSPTNWHTPAFGLLADDRSALAEVASALFEPRARRVSLAFLDGERPDAGATEAAATRAGYRTLTRPYQRSPYVRIAGDWEAYERSLDGKFRQNLRRRRRALDELGQVRLVVEDGSDRLDAALAEAFRIEASGWKGEQETAIASRPQTAAFYREVARWAAERGTLRLLFLEVDGRAVAVQYALEERGVYYLLKEGYDAQYRKQGPGALLRRESLARAFDEGLTRYEFLGHADAAKLEWTSTVHALVLFQAFAPTLGGRADLAAHEYARPLAKRALGAAARARSRVAS